jgi:type II secretory pathway component PulK
MSGKSEIRNPKSSDRRGSALIVALWVILLLTILVGGMAFEMKVEANVAGFYRKRVKAQYLAQAGVEWTKAMLNKKVTETAGGWRVAGGCGRGRGSGAQRLPGAEDGSGF